MTVRRPGTPAPAPACAAPTRHCAQAPAGLGGRGTHRGTLGGPCRAHRDEGSVTEPGSGRALGMRGGLCPHGAHGSGRRLCRGAGHESREPRVVGAWGQAAGSVRTQARVAGGLTAGWVSKGSANGTEGGGSDPGTAGAKAPRHVLSGRCRKPERYGSRAWARSETGHRRAWGQPVPRPGKVPSEPSGPQPPVGDVQTRRAPCSGSSRPGSWL